MSARRIIPHPAGLAVGCAVGVDPPPDPENDRQPLEWTLCDGEGRVLQRLAAALDVLWHPGGHACFGLRHGGIESWDWPVRFETPDDESKGGVVWPVPRRWMLELDGHTEAHFAADADASRFAVAWFDEAADTSLRTIERWGYTLFDLRGRELVPLRRYVEERRVPWRERPTGPVFSRCGRLLLSVSPPNGDAMDGDAGHLVVNHIDRARLRRVRLIGEPAPTPWSDAPSPDVAGRPSIAEEGGITVPLAGGRIARLAPADVEPNPAIGHGDFVRSPGGRYSVAVDQLAGWWCVGEEEATEPRWIGWWRAVDHAAGLSATGQLHALIPLGLKPPPGEERDVPRPVVFITETVFDLQLPTGDLMRVDLAARGPTWEPPQTLVGERQPPCGLGPPPPLELPDRELVDGLVPIWRHRYDVSMHDPVTLRLAKRPPGPLRYLCVMVELELEGDYPDRELPTGSLDDLEMAGCLVTGPELSWRGPEEGSARWFAERPVVQRLRLLQTMWTPPLEGFVLSDCTFQDVRSGKMHLLLRQCGFRRVVLRGAIGSVSICDGHAFPEWGERADTIDSAAERAFYDDVDWAMDIREANFSSFSLQGVPPEKVLHDPAIHAVLHRENVARLLKRADVQKTGFALVARMFAASPHASCLLMAHRRSKTFRRDRELLATLRKAKLVH